jgi:hypothetical protein
MAGAIWQGRYGTTGQFNLTGGGTGEPEMSFIQFGQHELQLVTVGRRFVPRVANMSRVRFHAKAGVSEICLPGSMAALSDDS